MSLSCWIVIEVGYEVDGVGTIWYSISYPLGYLSYFVDMGGVPVFDLATVEQGGQFQHLASCGF